MDESFDHEIYIVIEWIKYMVKDKNHDYGFYTEHHNWNPQSKCVGHTL